MSGSFLQILRQFYPDTVVVVGASDIVNNICSFMEFYLYLGVEGFTVYTMPQTLEMARVIDYYRQECSSIV